MKASSSNLRCISTETIGEGERVEHVSRGLWRGLWVCACLANNSAGDFKGLLYLCHLILVGRLSFPLGRANPVHGPLQRPVRNLQPAHPSCSQ